MPPHAKSGHCALTRANRVFCADEKRIRTENTVMEKPRTVRGFYTRSAIRADGPPSAQV
jgi:hypothetical protein